MTDYHAQAVTLKVRTWVTNKLNSVQEYGGLDQQFLTGNNFASP